MRENGPAIWKTGVVTFALMLGWGCGSTSAAAIPTTPQPSSAQASSPRPASRPTPSDGGKAVPSPTGSLPVDLTLGGAVSGHITAVAVSLCGGPMPGAGGGYRTVIVADQGSQVVTIQFAIFGPDFRGPGTYPEYKDYGNGGGEGLTIQVEPGDYFAYVLPGDPQGTFTINLGGASGTVSATNLRGNGGGKLSLSGSWRCR